MTAVCPVYGWLHPSHCRLVDLSKKAPERVLSSFCGLRREAEPFATEIHLLLMPSRSAGRMTRSKS